MSIGIDDATPQNMLPTRKITMVIWNRRLRPNRSPSLPHNGVEIVVARRYAVMTHDRWLMPPRSPTIVGSAVATMV